MASFDSRGAYLALGEVVVSGPPRKPPVSTGTGEARPSNDAAEFIAPLRTAFIKLEKPAVILALTFAKTGSIAFVTLAC